MTRRSPAALALALLLCACSTADEAPCGADRDCPSGVCNAGVCAPVDAADRGPEADGASLDGPPPMDGAPPDARSPLDAAPDGRSGDGAQPDAAADATPDAGGDPCDGGERFVRCDDATLRTERCVDGRWRAGPCRAVPPVPCGSVCAECAPREGTVLRVAWRLPPGPLGFDDRYLGGWVDEWCDGCTYVAEGDRDRVRTRRIGNDGVVQVEDCDGCQGRYDGAIDQRETWIREGGGVLRIERSQLPGGELQAVDRIVRHPDGRMQRYESSVIGGEPASVATWTYDAGGLWSGFETHGADGALSSRSVVERDADGRVTRLLRYGEGAVPERVYTFDLGCWQCDGDTCAQGAPAGCTHLSGMVPPVYLCAAECPDPLAPAWLLDVFEARFALRRIGDGMQAAHVGARVEDGVFVWTDSPRVVDPLLTLDEVVDGGPCARLSTDAEGRIDLAGVPCDAGPVLCRAPEVGPMPAGAGAAEN